MPSRPLILGAHLSVAGGIECAVVSAAGLGFDALQVFTHQPRAWSSPRHSGESIDAFKRLRRAHRIRPVVVHAPYLPNVATPDAAVWRHSISVVTHDLKVADSIEAAYYVLHPGSTKGREGAFGVQRVADALCMVFDSYLPRLTFLLENTSGAGSLVGSSFAELADIIGRVSDRCPSARLGVCMDTAHCCAAGIDVRSTTAVDGLARDIRATIGARQLCVIHANDSATPCGSHRDHHAHIGKGTIGLAGFANLMALPLFRSLPWILETPKDDETSDAVNAAALRALYASAGEARAARQRSPASGD